MNQWSLCYNATCQGIHVDASFLHAGHSNVTKLAQKCSKKQVYTRGLLKQERGAIAVTDWVHSKEITLSTPTALLRCKNYSATAQGTWLKRKKNKVLSWLCMNWHKPDLPRPHKPPPRRPPSVVNSKQVVCRVVVLHLLGYIFTYLLAL